MNDEVKILTDGETVTCCGWCFPGQTIFKKYPALAGKKISHGICPVHTASLRAEMDAMAFLSRPVGK